jgi:cytochrome P450
MLGSWIRRGMKDKRRLQAEVLFQIIAGSDTTAVAIRSTILYALNSTRVLQNLRSEIDEAIRAGKISNPITNADSKELPYLRAVIKEGLLIHLPSSGLLMK